MASKVIFIGDVHGCLDELRSLLDAVGPTSEDRVIFLGDLVDRGPDPVGVVRFVREMGAECLIGNHEEKHVRYARHATDSARTGKKIPMRPFTGERAMQHLGLLEHMDWLQKLPAYLEVKDEHGGATWLAVHGGFVPDVPIAEQDMKRVCRTRYLNRETLKYLSIDDSEKAGSGAVFWTEVWPGPQNVVYGHEVHEDHPRIDHPKDGVMCIGIDTGCCFGGWLTAMVVGDGDPRSVQVMARQTYAKRERDAA